MSDQLGGLLRSPIAQAVIPVGMLLLYVRFVWEYRRALRRRLEDPEWKVNTTRFLVWKSRMWSFLGVGAWILLVVAVDLFGGTTPGTTTAFTWGFGILFVWVGATAFIEGFMEGPGGNSQ